MSGTIEYLHELEQEYSTQANEARIKMMRAEMLGIARDNQILEGFIPVLEQRGYNMSHVMDTLDRDSKEVNGTALIFKRREIMHSDFWYGQLVWIGLQKIGKSIMLSVHHGQVPKAVYFETNSGLKEEERESFRRYLDKALETPGRYEWYEGMADERYIYV